MVLKVSVSISQTTFASYIGTCGLFEKRWGCTVLRVTRCCMDTAYLCWIAYYPSLGGVFLLLVDPVGIWSGRSRDGLSLFHHVGGLRWDWRGRQGVFTGKSGAWGWWKGCWLTYHPCWASSPRGAVRSWWDIWGTNVCLLLGKAEPSRPGPGWVVPRAVLCVVEAVTNLPVVRRSDKESGHVLRQL